jgi:hypothetical protein
LKKIEGGDQIKKDKQKIHQENIPLVTNRSVTPINKKTMQTVDKKIDRGLKLLEKRQIKMDRAYRRSRLLKKIFKEKGGGICDKICDICDLADTFF